MKYTHKNIIEIFREKTGKPMLVRELMRQLKLTSSDRRELKHTLNELVLAGELVKTRGNRYGLLEKMDLETGIFQAHPQGFGFVIPEKKGKTDLYISPRGRCDAMDGDRVVVRVSTPGRTQKKAVKREGVIIRILERSHTKVVGTYELPERRSAGYGFVLSHDPKITQELIVSREQSGEAQPGDIVSAEIISYPVHGRPPQGRIVKVIGRPEDPGIDSELIIEEYDLPVRFSSHTVMEAEDIPQQVTGGMIKGRHDLRNLLTVTIDGEKARDFDDAISIAKLKMGYRLWVHIADVAHYVEEDTYLDDEAYQRGTSVYLPDRAIPMLPTALSNGICSLKPNVDRLTLTCQMDISTVGEVLKYDIYESVIRSNERMTYTSMRDILLGRDAILRKQYSHLLPDFELMGELMEIRRARRSRRGSIDFDLPEPEIILDLQGRITDIIKSERNMSHQIVEEFMIAANETVARHIERKQVPFIYRIHEEPAEEKLVDLAEFLSTLDITLPMTKNIRSMHLQKALGRAKGTPEEMMINTILLRTMKQARYSEKNAGHFGLASDTYTHFTSPIRRYPDLVVHRILKADLRGKLQDRNYVDHLQAALPGIAIHCSNRERIAMEAERDVVTLLKLRFMEDKIGDIFDGVITSVTQFGFFVQLNEVFAEGLVHVSTLTDDYYHYNGKTHCLRGERLKKTYRIGDEVRVCINRVDMIKKRIDLSLERI